MLSNCSSLSSLPDVSKWATNESIDVIELFYNYGAFSLLLDNSLINAINLEE